MFAELCNSSHYLGEGNGTPLQYSCLENPIDEKPGGCSPWGRKESNTTGRLHFHFSLSYIGEGNGNPLQCSCLENPRDGGAWWAAVYGVTQSRTRLKRLSSSSSHYLITEHLHHFKEISYPVAVISNSLPLPSPSQPLSYFILLFFLVYSGYFK